LKINLRGIAVFAAAGVLRSVLWLFRQQPLFSIEVFDSLDSDTVAARREVLERGLGLIREFDPSRFRRVQRDLRRIILWDTNEAAEALYFRALRACVLFDGAKLTPVRVATLVVHEATHARLFNRGIGYAPDSRVRVEQLCNRSEIAFLKRVPGAEEALRVAEGRLSKPVWYTDEEARSRAAIFLRQSDLPPWLQRLHAFLFKPR
jgi:hypothetical protein